jgi:alcohol dehydrogenase class IV
MDALTHNIEAYLAKNFHPICDGIALEGVRLIAAYLRRAVREPDLESRAGMLLASMMGAIAFQKGLGVVHSTAHPLSSKYDTHHGLANAVMIPYGIEFNSDVSVERLTTLATVIGLKQPSAKALVAWLHELNAQIGIPSRLGALGVPEADLDELAGFAFADFAHPNNPKPVTRGDFLKIYKKAL